MCLVGLIKAWISATNSVITKYYDNNREDIEKTKKKTTDKTAA